MPAFDPDEFLAEQTPAAAGFNPDAFLAEDAAAPPSGFDPDAFLADEKPVEQDVIKADSRNIFQRYYDSRKGYFKDWWSGLKESTAVGVDSMRADPFRKDVAEGKVTGGLDDHWKMGGWSASQNNRVSGAALAGDLDAVRSAVKEDREILAAVGDKMDLSKANLLERGLKGAAASGAPMVESIGLGAYTGALPFVGPVAGKTAVGAYWQQQGAGDFLRSFLRNKDVDALTPEQLKEYNQISQAMAVPYAAIEFSVSAIPGMKALGSGVDQQIAGYLFRKAAANPTVLQKLAKGGTSFGIRWALESLWEEGAQGADADAAQQMMEKASQGDKKSLVDLVRGLDVDRLKKAFVESGVESVPSVGIITALGGGAAGVSKRLAGSQGAEVRDQESEVNGQPSSPMALLEKPVETVLKAEEQAPAGDTAEAPIVDPAPAQAVQTLEQPAAFDQDAFLAETATKEDASSGGQPTAVDGNFQEVKSNEQFPTDEPGSVAAAGEDQAGGRAVYQQGAETVDTQGRASYADGTEVALNGKRYVHRSGQWFNSKGGNPISRKDLLSQIESKSDQAEVSAARRQIKERRDAAEQAVREFYAKDPVAAMILENGGIQAPDRKGVFGRYPDEYIAIPKDFHGKVTRRKTANGKLLNEYDRSGLALDEQATGVAESLYGDNTRFTDEDLRAHLITLGEKAAQIRNRILAGESAPDQVSDAEFDAQADQYLFNAMLADIQDGILPDAEVRKANPQLYADALASAGADESALAESDAVTPDDLEAVDTDFNFGANEAVSGGRRGAQASPQGSYGGTQDGELGTAGVPVDDPKFSALPFEMPELVQLAEMLSGGKLPQVKQQLRALRGNAAGVFHGIIGRGPVDIQLKADIFELIPGYEQAEMAKAAAVYAANRQQLDGLTDDEAGKLAKEFFDKTYAEERAKRLKEDPIGARKTLAHEIMHWIDFVPQNVMARGNIFGHIGAFTKYYKSMMAQLPENQDQLLTDKDRKNLRNKAEGRVGPKPPKDEAAELAAWRDEVSRVYAELVIEEAEMRGLVTRAQIVEELEPMIAWWRGTERIEAYFQKPEEMYAEAGSVFLNNPAAVAKRAPLYFRMMHEWMESRPEVQQIYQRMQEDIRSGVIHKNRVKRLHEAFRKSDQQLFSEQDAGGNVSAREKADWRKFTFDRVFGPVYARMRDAKVSSEQQGRIQGALENYLYRATGHEYYMGRISQEVMNALHSNDLTWENLSEYMFHQRVMNERADMANPLGFTSKSSGQRLAEMAATLGPQRYAALERARKAFWEIRKDTVLEMLKQSGYASQELLEKIEDNLYYATFAVNRDGSTGNPGSIEEMLRRTYGSNVGAKIYKQIGTLQRIMDPAAATVMKDLSLMDAARRNVAKTEIIDLLRREFPDEIKPAEMRWTGQRREIQVRDGDRASTLVVMRNGKPEGWYVPKVFAEAFERGNPIENTVLLHSMSAASRGVKNLFTQVNYGFWPVAFVRDVMAYQSKMPRVSGRPFGGPQFWRNFRRALVDSWSSVMGAPNAGALESLSKQDWITVANPLAGKEDDVAIDRLLRRYWQNPEQLSKDRPVIDQIVRVGTKWLELGQVMERTVKRTGRMYLDRNFPNMPEWRKQFIVHNYSGSPNFLQKGAGNQYMDFVALFYNPWKESIRSTFSRVKESPATMAWNTAKFAVSPKVLMWLFASGAMIPILKAAFGDDGEEWGKDIQEQYKYVPEYDKTNYTIIPLGWNDKAHGKVMYLRLPLAEEMRIASGFTWKALGKQGDVQQVLNYMGGQLPVGNPVWEVPLAWAQYSAGMNPYDWFRGRPLLNDDLAAARDWRGMVAMGKYTWNAFGGSIVHRFDVNNYGENPNRTRAEKFLDLPIISNALGRWIKVSNRGYADTLREQVSEPIRRAQARSRVSARDAFNSNNPERISQVMRQDPRAAKYLMDNVKDLYLRKALRPEDAMMQFAPTSEEKAALSAFEMMGR